VELVHKATAVWCPRSAPASKLPRHRPCQIADCRAVLGVECHRGAVALLSADPTVPQLVAGTPPAGHVTSRPESEEPACATAATGWARRTMKRLSWPSPVVLSPWLQAEASPDASDIHPGIARCPSRLLAAVGSAPRDHGGGASRLSSGPDKPVLTKPGRVLILGRAPLAKPCAVACQRRL
jgi:hypothetical protein